jgi:hypothetical protein
MKETITIGEDSHVIDVKPITIICPSDRIAHEIEYDPKRIRVDIDATLYHMERLSDEGVHKEFPSFWDMFYMESSHKADPPCEPIPSKIRLLKKGHKHIAGLIDMCLKLQDVGAPFVLVEPETALHPALQVSIADFVIRLNKRAEEKEAEDGKKDQ